MKWHPHIDDLLDIAKFLVAKEIGRPKQASLRKAASSAYYATFLEVAHMCADEVVGWSSPWDEFTPICRSIEHSRVKSVLNEAAKDKSSHPSISALSGIFGNLQNARFEADYNPQPFFLTRRQTSDVILEAAEFVEAMRRLPRSDKRRLAIALIARATRRSS